MNSGIIEYRYCGICGRPFPVYAKRGRAGTYCSDVCRHISHKTQQRESKQRKSVSFRRAKLERSRMRHERFTLTEWAKASNVLCTSYGVLRHKYEHGTITAYVLKNAVAVRDVQIKIERKKRVINSR